jgi:hypothetical protein
MAEPQVKSKHRTKLKANEIGIMVEHLAMVALNNYQMRSRLTALLFSSLG